MSAESLVFCQLDGTDGDRSVPVTTFGSLLTGEIELVSWKESAVLSRPEAFLEFNDDLLAAHGTGSEAAHLPCELE